MVSDVAARKLRSSLRPASCVWLSGLLLLAGLWAPAAVASAGVPVTLEEVIDHAHAASQLARLAEAQRSVGRAESRQVESSLKPTLTVGGLGARMEQTTLIPSNCVSLSLPIGGDGDDTEEFEICLPPADVTFKTEGWNREATVSLRMAVFPTGLVRATRALAALQEQSAEADHTEALNELTLQVIELYYGVLQAEAAVHLLELALEEARLELAELDWQVAAAAASQAEYLQAVSRSLELEGQLIQAQGALERARIALNHVAGYPLDTSLQLQRPQAAILSVPTLWEALKAAENRPDIRKARIQVEQAEANRTVVQNQTGPTVQLFGQVQRGDLQYTVGIDRSGFAQLSLSYSETELESAGPEDQEWGEFLQDLQTPTADGWTVGIRASLDILDGGARRAQLDKADAQAELARLHLEFLLAAVESELRQAEAAVKGALGAWEAAKKMVEAMAEAEASTEEMYRRGAVSERNLLQVRLARARAEQELLQAEYEYMKALAQYRKAAGLL